MEMVYSLIWEESGLIEKYSGEVAGPEMNEVNELVAADPRLDNLRWVIADFRNASVSEDIVTYYDEASAMAYAVSLTNSRITIAVVTHDAKLAEIAARFEEYPIPFPYRVFRTMKEARGWIQSSPQKFEQTDTVLLNDTGYRKIEKS